MKRSGFALRKPDGAARLVVKVFKPKTCKACREKFTPVRDMQAVCLPPKPCAQVHAEMLRARKAASDAAVERKALKERKEKAKRRQDWVADAQAAFNRYVRLRDIAAGHGCIDCGKPFEPERPGGAIDAGHYLSRGSAPHLKFDERNVFAQRKNCNRPGGATRDDFRAGVVARIGLPAVEALEADQSTKKYDVDALKAIRDTYRAKARAIEKGME